MTASDYGLRRRFAKYPYIYGSRPDMQRLKEVNERAEAHYYDIVGPFSEEEKAVLNAARYIADYQGLENVAS